MLLKDTSSTWGHWQGFSQDLHKQLLIYSSIEQNICKLCDWQNLVKRLPLLVGDIEKMGLHQGERRMWRPTLGVPNKAVSSTSVQMSPVLLITAALGAAWVLKDSHRLCQESVFLAGSSPAGSLVSLV